MVVCGGVVVVAVVVVVVVVMWCVGVLVVVVVPTCAYNRGVCPSKLTSTSIYGDHVLVDMTPGPVPMYRDTKTNRKIPNAPAD